MEIIVGIIFITVFTILEMLMYGEYMWGKGYREGFKQAEKYCRESSSAEMESEV